MAIFREHLAWYKEILDLSGFLADPVLLFGYQDIFIDPVAYTRWRDLATVADVRRRIGSGIGTRLNSALGRAHPDVSVPEEFSSPTLTELLKRRGLRDIRAIDLFDARADIAHDMNLPLPEAHHSHYGTLIDIGSLEHVFDTRQAIENCMRAVRVGGCYLLHTTVKGYFKHGLHTLDPDGLRQAFVLNGFEIMYEQYCTEGGRPLRDPADGDDVLLWLVGRKQRELETFVVPQQGKWAQAYADGQPERQPAPPAQPAGGKGRRIARRAYRTLERSPLRPVLETRPVAGIRTRVAGPPGVDVGIDTVSLRVPERFRGHYAGGYERRAVDWLGAHLRPGGIAVDVGAHIGYLALVMARAVGPAGSVIAVEPAPENLTYLRANVARNGARNVAVIAAGAGAASDTRELHLTGSSDSHGFYDHPLTPTVASTTVEQVRLDDLVARADVIKIDVEGAELEVLAGMTRLLEAPHPPALLVEWMPACQRRAGHTPRELPDALRSAGYRLTVLDDLTGEERSVEQIVELLDREELFVEWYANLACLPAGTGRD